MRERGEEIEIVWRPQRARRLGRGEGAVRREAERPPDRVQVPAAPPQRRARRVERGPVGGSADTAESHAGAGHAELAVDLVPELAVRLPIAGLEQIDR